MKKFVTHPQLTDQVRGRNILRRIIKFTSIWILFTLMLVITESCGPGMQAVQAQLVSLASSSVAVVVATGQPISNLAIYNRCYAKLTNLQPALSDARTQQVASGQLDPVAARMQVLNKAIFNSSGSLTNTSDKEALAVLKTMHNLHASWMNVHDFSNTESQPYTSDIYDTTTPAAYITNALFAPTPSYKSVVVGNTLRGPLRANMNPANGVYTNNPLSKLAATAPGSYPYAFTSSFSFAGTGQILGVRVVPQQTASGEVDYQKDGTGYLFRSYGGGVLGDNVYLNLSTYLDRTFVADGSLNMPRRWSRDVYHDFLCRDLPVLRATDGSGFVSTTAQAPFRHSQTCTTCHDSLEHLAGTIRGTKLVQFGYGDSPVVDTVDYTSVTQPAEGAWPTAPDSNFSARPTNGALVYRNYNGDLVSQNLTSVEDLGAALQTQDDYYVCAAKRYYEYFTGISVSINDIGDPRSPLLATGDLNRRNIVINLGLNFRKTDNLRQLINDIFNLPHFKDSALGQ